MKRKTLQTLSYVIGIGCFVGAALGGIVVFRPYAYVYEKLAVLSVYEPGANGLFLYQVGVLTQLTPPGVFPIDIAWSPDGENIAFTYSRNMTGEEQYIGVVNIRTQEFSKLIHISQDTPVSFVWSPDGEKILFSMLSPEGFSQLYLLDVQTENVTPTLLVLKNSSGQEDTYIAHLAWSSGPYVLVNVCSYDADATWQCKVYSANSNFSTLTYIVSDAWHPEWLSDGETIVYSCLANERTTSLPSAQNPFGLCSYSTRSHTVTTITSELNYAVWSPDGRFAYSRIVGGEGDKSYWIVYEARSGKTSRLPQWVSDRLGYHFAFP